jgi:effector-binding domain-containing protein
MSYQCEVTKRASQPTLNIRTRTAVEDLPRVLGQAYGSIAQYLGELGEQPAGPPFVAYHNQDMQDLDIEIGFSVARQLPGRGDIQAGEIPGGKVATCLHIGPYSEIGPAYTALSQWMEEQGYEPTGVAYESYLNDPEQTPPEELRTQIAFPLKGGPLQLPAADPSNDQIGR